MAKAKGASTLTNFPQDARPNLNELGVSGTKVLAGLIYEELNPNLVGSKAFRVFQEMRFDATCAAMLKATEFPIRSARWFWDPADQDQASIDKADFMHDMTFNFGTQSMDDILRLALTKNPFGFSWMETIYEMIEGGQWAGKVGWERFAWRPLALDTPIPTPTGWTTMGQVQPGDRVFDEHGQPVEVAGKSPVYEGRKCFEVVLASGERIIADAEHPWVVKDVAARKQGLPARTVTTAELAARVMRSNGKRLTPNWSIAATEPLDLPGGKLPVDPYVLGFWLGDGCRGTATYAVGLEDELEMADLITATGEAAYPAGKRRWSMADRDRQPERRYRAKPRFLRDRLRQAGVLLDKHVPTAYMRASAADRLALLQGLMDADGTCGKRGSCSFSNTSPALAGAVEELARSLGAVSVSVHWSQPKNERWLRIANVHFAAPFAAFRLKRKLLRQKRHHLRSEHFIFAVNEVPSVPVQCISVKSESHLFLAGRTMVPTHNSQATKWRWNFEEVDGRQELVSVTQLAPPYYSQIDIPRDKLALFVNQQEGDNYDGWSALRAAWKDYFIRDMLYRIRAIGLERGYMGIPVASMPAGMSKEYEGLARQIVETMRVDEQAGVVKPEDLTLELFTTKLDGPAMNETIHYHNRQILVSGLAHFIDLGGGKTGSWGLSSDQSELFLMALNGDANYIAQVMNLKPLTPTLIRMNFPDADDFKMPKLMHGDIGQRSLEKLGRTLSALGQWGFLTPDDATEDALRQMLELPERDQDLADRDLFDIIEEVAPSNPVWRKVMPETDRLRPTTLAPGGAAGVPAKPGAAPPVGKSATPVAGRTAPKAASDQTGAGGEFSEVMGYATARMGQKPWPKPRDRHEFRENRKALLATEAFAEVMADFKSNVGSTPERPSERAWRLRRPYEVIQMRESAAATIAKAVQKAKDGQLRPVDPAAAKQRHQTVSTRQAAIAKTHINPVKGVFRDAHSK